MGHVSFLAADRDRSVRECCQAQSCPASTSCASSRLPSYALVDRYFHPASGITSPMSARSPRLSACRPIARAACRIAPSTPRRRSFEVDQFRTGPPRRRRSPRICGSAPRGRTVRGRNLRRCCRPYTCRRSVVWRPRSVRRACVHQIPAHSHERAGGAQTRDEVGDLGQVGIQFRAGAP